MPPGTCEALTSSRGSFAATFSSTGKYLAVGTQYGAISIFNAAALAMPGMNALITSFDTSRPNAEFGAVRDMAFSPGPIDLLAWTEDRGRVGVADIRSGFDSRQILYIDKEDEFEHCAVTDRGTIDPRLLEQRVERGDSLLSNFASALDSSSESRQNRLRQPEGPTPLARYNIPLTAEETAILEAIQDGRRRQDQYNASSGRTAPENGSSSNGNATNGSSAAPRPPWAQRAAREALRTREHAANVSQAVNDVLDSMAEQRMTTSRDVLERLRAREESAAERRRYASPPSPPPPPPLGPNPMMTPTTTTTTTATAAGAAAALRFLAEVQASSSSLPSSAPRPSGGGSGGLLGAGAGWDIVETLYGDSDPVLPSRARRRGDGDDRDDRDRDPTVLPRILDLRSSPADLARRYRVAYLMREWEETAPGGARQLGTFLASPHARPGPHDTAGLAWGEDGGVL